MALIAYGKINMQSTISVQSYELYGSRALQYLNTSFATLETFISFFWRYYWEIICYCSLVHLLMKST